MNKRLILVLVVALPLFSCVAARKYDELNADYESLQRESNSAKSKIQELEADNLEYQQQLEQLTEQVASLKLDTASIGKQYRRTQQQYEKINKLNDELLQKYSKLQKGSEQENAKILRELENTRLALQEKEDRQNVLALELESKEKNLSKLEAELTEREANIKQLKNLLAKKDSAVLNLRNRIAQALLNFKDKGLTVEQRNGKVYVSLEAKLLFPSGSTVIDKEGKEALTSLANVLQDQKDLEILVEGHTDTDKLKGSTYPHNNWELSVLRSTAVVELMLANSNINPAQLVAAGRSEFVPVDPAVKAKNRRIEIILTPNLDKLFEIIDAETKVAADEVEQEENDLLDGE